MCVGFILAAFCGNIALRLQINEVNSQINSVKGAIAELDSEKTCLEVEMQRRISYSNLELKASELGMTKPEKENVVYIRVNDKDAARIADGTVVAPASKEDFKIKRNWKCFVDISKDDGLTFEHSNFVLRPKKNAIPVNMIQPTLWESDEGLHMLVRTSRGSLYRSDSRDGGKSWCKAYETPLSNPNSGVDVVKMDNGCLVLIMNPVSENWGDRAPLVLMSSFDNGKTFTEFFKCEKLAGDYEFSYPAIVADKNALHITYTYERKTIAYQKVEVSFE